MGFIYIPNGTIQPMWVPATTGAGFELSPILSPLAPVRDRLVVLSGLAHMEADSRGDGNGDHARATAVWLTGVHAYDRDRTGVAGVQLATTVDQIAARELGKDTRLPSLEISLEKPTQIGCDSEDCFFSNTISWRSATTPLPMEPHPRVVFERLFGDGGTAAQRLAQTRRTGSILDSVTQEVAGLEQTLGSSDRTKLGEYLEAVRELEQRIQNAERRGAESELALPDRPADIPETFEEHAKLMFDLQVVAYQADITRVFSMLLARETSPLTYENIGVPEQHHSCSHHLNNPKLIARKAKIDQYHVQLLGYFLKRLRDTPRRRRLAARSFDDSLWRRVGQRQHPRSPQPAVPPCGRGCGSAQGRPSPGVSGEDPDDEPAPQHAGQGRGPHAGKNRRQHDAPVRRLVHQRGRESVSRKRLPAPFALCGFRLPGGRGGLFRLKPEATRTE